MKQFRKTAGDRIFNFVTMTIFGLFALVCAWPFYYLIINTISNNTDVAMGRIVWVPRGIHFANYGNVLQLPGIYNAAFISLSRTVIGSVFSVISASFLGYCMTKSYFWHKKFWYRYMIITMYFSAGLIPWYMVMNVLQLNNNYLVYILPSLSQSFNMILVKTYIESLPASLEESAEIDGAGSLRRYISIIMPLSTPILATIAIFSAVGHWNSYTDTVFLVTKESLYTLQYLLYRNLHEAERLAALIRANPALYKFQDTSKILTPAAVRYTISVVAALPILCVYPFFQRYFVKGIMIGAVKG
ncbi:MAG: carbohydrate ABC transporter permease [Treponema sp.]|jgi:ABC-type glycerol-3-phosphate transport system permease component|nr:carbohydrate ABC transporter permease [Treponema sp.]